jgi:alpha-glucosidase
MADGGYDVADPCEVDPLFGTLADFDDLLAAAHDVGIKVTVDVVPNHFSIEHPWFQAALRARPGSPERARFIFRDGHVAPNNWPSVFGGPAWTQVPGRAKGEGADGGDGEGDGGDDTEGQWYLHLFAPEQPDLDWTNPEVSREYDRILRFWLDRGVDGFRIDVAHGMAKPAGLPDMEAAFVDALAEGVHMPAAVDPRWDQDAVHEIHRRFRRVIDEYPDRMAVGEAWVPDDERLARYVRPDELNLTFNFELVEAAWGAAAFRAAITASLAAMADVGAPCSWVLGNHDVDRPPTRYGSVERARAAALVQLSLPGAVYIYNGDELGLSNVELPDWALQDPNWERSGHTQRGRDGERVPLPWSGDAAPYGFSSADTTWLPMPTGWASLTVAAQERDPASTLSLFRAAIRLRKGLGAEFAWQPCSEDVLAYRRGHVAVVVNFGSTSIALPDGDVLITSARLDHGALPPDAAAWVDLSTQH